MPHFPSVRTVTLASALAALFALLPIPAGALGPPETLAAERTLGSVDGREGPIDPAFTVDFVVVSWTEGDRPAVRFRHGEKWTDWTLAPLDHNFETIGDRTYSALLGANDADAYQVRGHARGVEALALNTTDGPRAVVWEQPEAEASHLGQPPIITRPLWGADEDLRFNGPDEKGTRTFYPTQKLIVHHTVTANGDPDPAATIRAIYFDHVINRGFVDIAYNFLLDAQGRLYKGRYSGPQNTKTADTITGENVSGWGVTGAHTGGYNSGTMGIAILGNHVSTPITAATRQTLVQHLAWEAERHVLPPLSTSTYTNPESGAKRATQNIGGHRDYTATQCPGGSLYAALPGIRQEAAALVGQLAEPDIRPPRISRIQPRKVRQRSAILRWRTSEPATGQVQYWEPGKKRRTTRMDPTLKRGHKARLGGLQRGTTYRYRLLGWDAAGNASQSRPKRLTTTG